jgi:hypothetical protein
MRVCAAAVFVLLAGTVAGADQITLLSSRDNTLYEDPAGALSNGAGPGFFAGATATGAVRRGLVGFDLSSIPVGALVTDATLTLHMSSSGSTPVPIDLHRVLADWGEGTSNAGANGGSGAPSQPGDATWLHRFYPGTLWAMPGGDFAAAVSASQSVAGVASYAWSGAGLLADVQGWVAAPGSNFGWLLTGGEQTAGSAKRFDSRENGTASFRPQLSITYTVPGPGGPGVAALGLLLAARRRRR